ncbi:MAG: glycosyltransferase family 39 protein [Candidatus Woesebacteria bacterium]|nr:MAG: glycosyltransferase family 39 protein [Candidatus Woesebacteria bacterium]
MIKNWKIVLYCLIIVVAILAVYMPVTRLFFQQDEWLGYGLSLVKGRGMILQSTGGVWGIILGQGRIFTNVLLYLFHNFFPRNILPVAVFAISLHITNSLLVFYLTGKLFKSSLMAFFAGLFFAVNSVSQNAVTWMAASVNTLPSTALILISLVFYFKYLESDKPKWLITTFALVYLSLFFKETGIFLLLFLPVSTLIFKKYSLKKFIYTYWYFFLSSLTIVVFRLLQFKLTPNPDALFLTGATSNYWAVLLTRVLFYPLTSFSLVFVPSEPFLWFARLFTLAYYPFPSSPTTILIAQTAVLDLLAVCLSGIILILIGFFIKLSSSLEKKHISFFCIFLLVNYLPFTVVSKSFSYLESRYYYLSSVAAGVILAWLLFSVYRKIKIFYIKPVIILFFLLFMAWHVKYINDGLKRDVETASERKNFIYQLMTSVPSLDQNINVFYFNSDSDYYIAGNKVPFQEGMGYTLMTLYYNGGKIPADLLRDSYLFEIGGNGYSQVGNYGFGYFTDKEKLELTIKANKLNKSKVYSFYYNSKTKTLSMTE